LKGLFDTNVLVNYLQGIPAARDELNRYTARLISVITWMEVLAGCRDANEKAVVRWFLKAFRTIELSAAIAERAVTLRRQTRLKLPDAIIQATAQEHNALLVTRNTKDFDPALPGVRVPYDL
jgi:predicted nucleic acid-binding protein